MATTMPCTPRRSRCCSTSTRRDADREFGAEGVIELRAILRLQNILACSRVAGDEISRSARRRTTAACTDLYAELRGQRSADKASINDDVVFEIELITGRDQPTTF